MKDADFHALAAHMNTHTKQAFAAYEPGDVLNGAIIFALTTRSLITRDGNITEFGWDFQAWLKTQEEEDK